MSLRVYTTPEQLDECSPEEVVMVLVNGRPKVFQAVRVQDKDGSEASLGWMTIGAAGAVSSADLVMLLELINPPGTVNYFRIVIEASP